MEQGIYVPVGQARGFGAYRKDRLDGWLPAPAHWATCTVEAQRRDADSMLGLYRAALRLRREHPALGDGVLQWAASPDGTLVFSREPGFVCTVNTGDEAVELTIPGTPLLASAPIGLPTSTDTRVTDTPVPNVAATGTLATNALIANVAATNIMAPRGSVNLPPDTAAWWAIDR